MTTIPYHIADKRTGEWKEHPRFKGVLLKPLLTRADNPRANINLVRTNRGEAGKVVLRVKAGGIRHLLFE